MKTEVTELLGIEYPIIQGGMAWVAEYHLAAGVSNASGRRRKGCNDRRRKPGKIYENVERSRN